MERFGIIGFLILIGDIYAVLKIVQSASSDGAKALWIAIVVAMPGLGLILWFFFGPKPR
jgi:ABC-type arginine transport system permease subunit